MTWKLLAIAIIVVILGVLAPLLLNIGTSETMESGKEASAYIIGTPTMAIEGGYFKITLTLLCSNGEAEVTEITYTVTLNSKILCQDTLKQQIKLNPLQPETLTIKIPYSKDYLGAKAKITITYIVNGKTKTTSTTIPLP